MDESENDEHDDYLYDISLAEREYEHRKKFVFTRTEHARNTPGHIHSVRTFMILHFSLVGISVSCEKEHYRRLD